MLYREIIAVCFGQHVGLFYTEPALHTESLGFEGLMSVSKEERHMDYNVVYSGS